MKTLELNRLEMKATIRKPDWFKVPLSGDTGAEVKRLLKDLNLHTVCREAHCPNIGECFNQGTATFLVLGEICTRNCRFCAVKAGTPEAPDTEEPERIAHAVQKLKLKHCVITGVNRDDLPLGGAEYYALTVRYVREFNHYCKIEVLPGDFSGEMDALKIVLDANPDVFNHNLETIRRLTPIIRDQRASYDVSMRILQQAKIYKPEIKTKSGLLVGLGETFEELIEAMKDLRAIRCDGITIGQYIPPSAKHYPVKKYYHPDEFSELEFIGQNLGFSGVAASPLVRSSYHAGDFFKV